MTTQSDERELRRNVARYLRRLAFEIQQQRLFLTHHEDRLYKLNAIATLLTKWHEEDATELERQGVLEAVLGVEQRYNDKQAARQLLEEVAP